MRTIKAATVGVLGLWLIAGFPCAGHGATSSPSVVASIGPVHSLTAAVMAGAGTPRLLLSGGASPHTASLRPSEAAALQNADAIIWIGEDLETFLVKPLAALSSSARVLGLAEAPGVTLLASRERGLWPTGHDDAAETLGHDHDHDHDHNDNHHDRGKDDGGDTGTDLNGDDADGEHAGGHDHAHGARDMHIWLDPHNAKAMAKAIANTLAAIDPDQAATYAANADDLILQIDALDADLRSQLAGVADRPYIVFHDAYHYFETRYQLSPAGAITINPDRTPGARTLAAIRERIEATGAICIFREPQFEPALVKTVASGTQARVAVLDPIGADLSPGPEAYFLLMRQLGDALTDCLSGG